MTVLIEEDVGGLNVPVDVPLLVHKIESIRNAHQPGFERLRWQWLDVVGGF